MNPPGDSILSSPPPLPLSPPAAPLDESQYQQIRGAAVARRVVRSAGRTARLSGIVTVSIAGLSLLTTAVSFNLVGLVLSAGIVVIGIVEFLGSRRFRRGEAAAARALGINQLAFLGLIAAYCVLQMATFSASSAQEAMLSPEFRSQLSALPGMQSDINAMVGKWAPLITYGFYALVILLSIGCQGAMALYYFTRRKHILAFNAGVPEWIQRLFREADI